MVKINLFLDDENGGLYQWDIGQRLRVYGAQAGVRVDYVMGTQALSVDTYAEGGNVYANIPNILLQQSGSIRALVYVTGEGYGETVKEARFRVQEREKPSDYVYTETEVKSYDDLADRVAALEESPVSREDIAEAVESYLSENPVVTEETDPTVPEWAKQPQKPTYTAEEVGALPDTTEIPTTLPNPKPLRIYDGVNNIYRNYTGEDAVQIVIPKVPTDVSAFKNDAGYLTEHQSLDGYAQKTDIPDVLPNPEPLLIHNIDGSGTTVEYNGVEPVQIHAIPNPKALTFTGAVQGEYDGSEALTVNIPEGGGSGGTDLTLGMTGATVGQIAKITAVDEDGKPTAWEPVEMPSDAENWQTMTWEIPEGTSAIKLDLPSPDIKKAVFQISLYSELDDTKMSIRFYADREASSGANGYMAQVENFFANSKERRTAILRTEMSDDKCWIQWANASVNTANVSFCNSRPKSFLYLVSITSGTTMNGEVTMHYTT